MSFLPTAQQTNIHLGTRHSRIENAPKIQMTGVMAKLRVELTLTKLHRMFRKRELETNYSCSQNCNHKIRSQHNKRFQLQLQVGLGNLKTPWPLQKTSKLQQV